jgi:hypothetical protein
MSQQPLPGIAMKERIKTRAECAATWTPAARAEAKAMIKALPKFTSNKGKRR